MRLMLSENHCLISDKHCYKLCELKHEKSKKTGEVKPVWKAYRYYSNMESVCKNVPEQLLRESGADGIDQVKKTLRSITERLAKAFLIGEIE